MGSLLHFVSRMVEVPQNMFGISSGSSFVFGIAGEFLVLESKSHISIFFCFGGNSSISYFKSFPRGKSLVFQINRNSFATLFFFGAILFFDEQLFCNSFFYEQLFFLQSNSFREQLFRNSFIKMQLFFPKTCQ